VIQVQSRDEMRKFLSENSIGTAIHYPAPVHLQPAYQGISIMGSQGLPITEQISPNILSLPMHAYLKDEEVETVCEQVKLWYSQPGSHE
jgi:dTDP-4-amino-4,6-dideoxygalactose transaminase